MAPVATRKPLMTSPSEELTKTTICEPFSAEYPCDLKSAMILSRSPKVMVFAPDVRKCVWLPLKLLPA